MTKLVIRSISRNGLVDMWNAFMVQHARFTKNDIPISRMSQTIPKELIGWDEAKNLYKKLLKEDMNFKHPAFIHFYLDDQKFDGKKSSVWLYPYKALKIIKHFEGVITPDFSTNFDFPKAIKAFNTYRMRAFDCFMDLEDITHIHNVRWGTKETWKYCFDGIPEGSVVSIGTVASGLKQNVHHKLFEDGFTKMIEVIKPKTIIIYGSSNYECFNYAKKLGIRIIAFPSATSLAFKKKGGNKDEQGKQ